MMMQNLPLMEHTGRKVIEVSSGNEGVVRHRDCGLCHCQRHSLGSYRWHLANTVFADAPLTSEFFRTYDPGLVLSKFGTVRQSSGFNGSSTGWRESTRTRGITAIIALPERQVAGLSAALRDDIDTKLRAQGRLMGSGEDSGEYSYEYESRSAWGTSF